MCGIAGWVNWPRSDGERLLDDVLTTLSHRGPDAEGACSGPGWAIGARRLAVIDLVTGDQPVENEGASVHAVLNGEIYNYAELRRHLEQRGHVLRSQGDTEVLVHLWEDEGPEMVRRLRGMFAFAVVDTGRRTLFLARDRVGKKPLYWVRLGGALFFASELKALRAIPDLTFGLDTGALEAFLQWGFVPEGACIYRGVAKLPPGHTLICGLDGGAETVERYWRLSLTPDSDLSLAAARDALGAVLNEAVALRLRSDVPLAVFLSGGLDSGVITALAARHTSKLRAITVAFEGESGELELARKTAHRAGVDLAELVVDPAAGLALLPQLAEIFDEPLADPSTVPTTLVAQAARSLATVVLNGDGGDEALGGYRRLLAARVGELPGFDVWGALASGAARVAGGLGVIPAPWAERLRRGLTAGRESYLTLGPAKFCPSEVSRLLGRPARGVGHLESLLEDHADLRGVDLMRVVDLEFFLPGDLLVKMDRATMASSLEARSPFLDHRLLELAATFPTSLLLRGMRGKAVLRSLARELLPAQVVTAPKRGFEMPLRSWLAGPWADDVRSVLEDPRARLRELLDGNALASWRDWSRHRDPQRSARSVFALLTLEHWLRRWT